MANDSDFVCVLRASCGRPGLGALLRAHRRWKPDAVWRAGVPNAVGRVPDKNGFNLFIAEGAEWKPVAAVVRRRMRALARLIEEGRKIGAEFELDVGVMLGGSHYWTRSTRFGPKDLEPLVGLGVELCVTAYPVSERSPPTRAGSRARRPGRAG